MKGLIAAVVIGTVGLVASAQGAIVTGITSAQIQGSNYDLLGGAFDAQPVVQPSPGDTTTTTGASFGGFHGSAPAIGINFGETFATKTFTDILILQGSYGTANLSLTYYWSTDTVYNDGVDVPTTNFNLFNYNGFGTGNGNGRWDSQFSSPTAIVPQAQYLIGRNPAGGTPSGSQGNFNHELLFLNNAAAVPEPTMMGLAGIAGLGLLTRRSRRA